jgi:chlorobactene glucosyltransferase
MRALFYIYLLLGPGMWALVGWGMIMSHFRMNRLRRGKTKMPENPPAVTVVIPAKDEGERLRTCFETVLALTYPSFNVVAIDDRSTDQTGAIMDEYAAKDSRVRVIHIPRGGLPDGWLGKCHALDTGVRGVASPWLLFVDSDVAVRPDSLSEVVSLAMARGYDAVSILTKLECHSLAERLVMPLAAAAVVAMYAVSLTNNDARKKSAFANGQFFLIRKSAYDKVGGHEAVKNRAAEDVELMRLLKLNDFRTRLYSGKEFASTHMYNSVRAMFIGWCRIYAGGSRRRPWRIFAALAILVPSLFGYIVLVMSLIRHSVRWELASGGHVLLITVLVALLYAWSGNPKRTPCYFRLGHAYC